MWGRKKSGGELPHATESPRKGASYWLEFPTPEMKKRQRTCRNLNKPHFYLEVEYQKKYGESRSFLVVGFRFVRYLGLVHSPIANLVTNNLRVAGVFA